MNKYSILNNFICEFAHLPEQGTVEWKALRRDFIGGSEISTILKQNKNKTVNKLIMEKLGFDPFKGNVITHWGNVFEELIRRYCEDEFNCSIKETGSIPYKHGNLSYSPDGLAVVTTSRLEEKFGSLTTGLDRTAANQLVLFEFKCPHSRIASCEIPKHYWPQVNIGMNIIDIMETAIFVQATYRRCSFSELQYNSLHTAYGHFKKADTSTYPIECGYMIISTETWTDYHKDLIEMLTETGDANQIHLYDGTSLIDIGTINDQNIFEEIMGNCVSKEFKVEYSYRYKYINSVFSRDAFSIDMYNESLQYRSLKHLQQQVGGRRNIIGVMPYKLLNVYLTPVDKNPNYIEETAAHSKAIKVLQCINDHRGYSIKADVSKSVRRYKL